MWQRLTHTCCMTGAAPVAPGLFPPEAGGVTQAQHLLLLLRPPRPGQASCCSPTDTGLFGGDDGVMAMSSAPRLFQGSLRERGSRWRVEGSPQQRAAEAARGEVAGPCTGRRLAEPGTCCGHGGLRGLHSALSHVGRVSLQRGVTEKKKVCVGWVSAA